MYMYILYGYKHKINIYKKKIVFACWRVVSEYPASDRECARNGLAIIIPFLMVSGSLLLCAHLI